MTLPVAARVLLYSSLSAFLLPPNLLHGDMGKVKARQDIKHNAHCCVHTLADNQDQAQTRCEEEKQTKLSDDPTLGCAWK